jgi:hypothetical protein
MDKKARQLAFKWLRCFNHVRRVATYLPPRPDLFTAAVEREINAWIAFQDYRNGVFAPPWERSEHIKPPEAA